MSVIATGPMAGKTIRDAIRRWGGSMLGRSGIVAARSFGFRGDPVFPLLIKYLDAAEHLSVQTHPSSAYASANPSAKLKTESWVVLDAKATTRPDGVHEEPSLFIGVQPGVTPERFRDHVLSGGCIVEDLERVPAVPGDCWTLPSGTLHALGAGVLVAEVQTPSDTTFRVYDWNREYGRPQREMHVDEAMRCIDFKGGHTAAPKASGTGRLATTAYYTIDRVDPGEAGARLAEEACTVLMATAGAGELVCADGCFEPVPIPAGATVLLPAACAGAASVRGDAGFSVLVVRIGAG
jgi:mannose-6-phosphate isomerase